MEPRGEHVEQSEDFFFTPVSFIFTSHDYISDMINLISSLIFIYLEHVILFLTLFSHLVT